MARRTQVFVKESVIFFGFLSGLFLAIGVNPGAALLEVARSVLENLVGESGWIALVFTLLPIVFVAASLYFIFKRGGWVGILAVAMAFVAGLWLLGSPTRAAALLVAAVLLGVIATR